MAHSLIINIYEQLISVEKSRGGGSNIGNIASIPVTAAGRCSSIQLTTSQCGGEENWLAVIQRLGR